MNVDKVAFTGSTVTGRSIMKAAAASNLKKVTLELGGKSPTIVFNDADLDAAIDWANFGIYFNHGISPEALESLRPSIPPKIHLNPSMPPRLHLDPRSSQTSPKLCIPPFHQPTNLRPMLLRRL